MSSRSYDVHRSDTPGERPPGPYGRQGPIRVSLAFYIISLVVVILAVFILMMVQYFPGYHTNYKLEGAMKNSYVTMTIEIPPAEMASRNYNPTNRTYVDSIKSLLESMGAKKPAKVVIKAGT